MNSALIGAVRTAGRCCAILRHQRLGRWAGTCSTTSSGEACRRQGGINWILQLQARFSSDLGYPSNGLRRTWTDSLQKRTLSSYLRKHTQWWLRVHVPADTPCTAAMQSHGTALQVAALATASVVDVGGISTPAAPPPPPPPPPSSPSTLRVHKQRKTKARSGSSGEAVRICAAYCLASGYRLEELRDLLRSVPLVTTVDASTLSRDVLHCRVRPATRQEQVRMPHADGHVFFFESGAAVFWDVDEETRRELLRLARRCDIQPGYNSNVTFEEFDHEFEFSYLMDSAQSSTDTLSDAPDGTSPSGGAALAASAAPASPNRLATAEHALPMPSALGRAKLRPALQAPLSRNQERIPNSLTQFRNDRIFLHDYADALSMLAISFGLAQSVKLLVFELSIDRLVEETRRLPEELAKYGRFRTVAQDDLRRRIGQLLTAKYSVALLSDILDTPEIFWEYPSSETVYNQSVQVVDLQKRARLLDKRMDIVQDSLALLNSELATSTTHRVERAIVALIAIELGLQVFNKLF